MKKRFFVVTSLLFGFLLVACDPSTYYFDYEDLKNNIINVDLINYENSNQKRFSSWVLDHSSDLVSFNLGNVTILETLNNDDIPNFLEQLSSYDILGKYYSFDSPKGICIRLTYSNGDFLIITCDYKSESFSGYIGSFTSNGEVKEFIGCFSNYDYFESLVSNFFTTKLD